MAGIAGMSSPNDIKINATAASPQGVSIPQPEVQAEPQVQDLDALATQFVSQQPAQDLDALAQSYVQEQAPLDKEAPSFGDKLLKDIKGVGETALGVVSDVAKASMAIPQGIAAEYASQVSEHPLTAISPVHLWGATVKGAAKGIMNPLSQPSFEESIIKLAPITGERMSVETPEYTLIKNKDGSYSASITNEQHKMMSPAKALDLAINIASPDFLVKGVVKAAPTINKLLSKGLSPAKEALDSVHSIGKLESTVDTASAISNNNKVINESLKTLEDINIKIPLTSDAIHSADPYLQSIAKEVNNNKIVQELKLATGNKIVDSINNGIPQALGQVTGETATTDDMLKILKGQKTKTGKDIGDLKNTAIKRLGNTKLQAPEFKKSFDEIKDSLTTQIEGEKLYISDNVKREELTKYLNSLEEKLFNNNYEATAGEWEKTYKELTKKGKANFKNETGPIYNNLRTKLSVDQNPMVAKGLEGINDEAAKMFADGKKNYSDIMNDIPDIKTFIKKDGIASESLYNATAKSKSLGSIDKTQSIIDILSIDNPKVAQSYKSGALKSINNDFRVPISPENPFGFDGKGWAKEIRRLGEGDKNMLDILSGGKEQSKAMLAMADVAEAFFKSYKGKEVVMNEKLFGRLLYYGKQAKLTEPTTYFKPFMDAANRDKKIGDLFKNMDVDEIVKAFPPNERGEAMSYIKKVMKK